MADTPKTALPSSFEEDDPNPPQSQATPAATAPNSGNQALPSSFEADDDDAPPVDNKPKGFIETAVSDVGNAVSGVGKAITYSATPEQDKANEANKHAVYKQFADQFHKGNYVDAIKSLGGLFSKDDPDPVVQMARSQWDSSNLARQRMVEAAEKGEYGAAVQHAAGILPVASQVDAAMEEYRKNPSRENLAHVVTSAIPAFIPSLMRTVGKGVDMVKGAASTADVGSGALPVQQAGAEVQSDLASQQRPVAPDTVSPHKQVGEAIQQELRSKEQPIAPPTAQSLQDAGQTAQDAMASTRQTQGAAVGAAKEAARPPAFTMNTGNWYSGLGQKLAEIDTQISGETEGLSTMKDTELDKIRDMIEKDLQNPRELDNAQIDKIRQQLNDKISQQTQAVKLGNATGTALKYYNEIKKAFDTEMYSQVENPGNADILQAANKTYADTVKSQTKGLAKPSVRTQSPEQVITRFANGKAGLQSEVESVIKNIQRPEAVTQFQDGILKQIETKFTKDGVTDWEKVQGDLEQKGDMAKSLLRDRYDNVMNTVKTNAKFQELKQMAPEKLVMRYVKATPEMQSETEELMHEISPTKQTMLQDNVLKQITDDAATPEKALDKVQKMGDTGKALFGDRYDGIVRNLEHNAKLEDLKGVTDPEKVVLKFAKGGPEMQTQGEELMRSLNPRSQKIFQDSVLNEIRTAHSDDWAGIQKDMKSKGAMLKSVLGPRYSSVMDEIAHNVKMQKLGKIKTGLLWSAGVGLAGGTAAAFGKDIIDAVR